MYEIGAITFYGMFKLGNQSVGVTPASSARDAQELPQSSEHSAPSPFYFSVIRHIELQI
jgi:hypothetical protein